MDPVFELVKELEPEALPPSTAARRRQHDALMLAIGEEDLAARHGSGRRRYLRRGPVVGVVVGILALTGGGIAAAVTLSSPTPQQSTSIYSHYYPDAGAGRVAGTRPTLNSEEVLCDYQGAGELPAGVRYGPVGDAFASAAPLTTPLTAQMLVNACSTVAPTGAVVPASVPATLCETATPSSVTDTPAGWPVVIFGDETCSSSGYVASSDLLAQVNHRRVIEATLDAVPEACPTQSQALDWVHQQLSALGIAMQVTSWYGGPGGSCYLPFVQWWWPPAGASLVQVTASEQAGNPPGSDTTTTLAG